VSIPTTPQLTNAIVKREFRRTEALDESEPLWDVFMEEPAPRTLHIVMEGLTELNCVVYGDGPQRIFSVKIAPTQAVSHLKELIMRQQMTGKGFQGDSRDLHIWKVSISAS
jgi:hypothetical protein